MINTRYRSETVGNIDFGASESSKSSRRIRFNHANKRS